MGRVGCTEIPAGTFWSTFRITFLQHRQTLCIWSHVSHASLDDFKPSQRKPLPVFGPHFAAGIFFGITIFTRYLESQVTQIKLYEMSIHEHMKFFATALKNFDSSKSHFSWRPIESSISSFRHWTSTCRSV